MHFTLCLLQEEPGLGYGLGGPRFESRWRQEIFFLIQKVQTRFGPPNRPCIKWAVSSGLSGRSVMLTNLLHLAPRLRKGGDIPLLPLYAFMSWTSTPRPYFIYCKTRPGSIGIFGRAGCMHKMYHFFRVRSVVVLGF